MENSPNALRLSNFMKIVLPEEKNGETAPGEAASKEATPVPNREVHNVDDVYLTARAYIEEVRKNVRSHAPIELDSALGLINKIVDSTELLFSIHPLTIKFSDEKDYDIFQPVHTMIYALKIGFRLNYQRSKLVELGLATLLQNIGMFLVPERILNKPGNFSDSEIAVIKKHPEIGRDILVPYEKDYPWLLETIYQHHERENGKGYPRNLKGDEIIEYAKIIGICDSYEAMTHNRPHKKALMQFTSIRQLIESKERLFSPRILKVFLEEMSLYPIGSYVKLNNGAICRVTHVNRSLPMKPRVRVLFDGRGDKAPQDEFIDMASSNILNIVDVVAEEDLPQ